VLPAAKKKKSQRQLVFGKDFPIHGPLGGVIQPPDNGSVPVKVATGSASLVNDPNVTIVQTSAKKGKKAQQQQQQQLELEQDDGMVYCTCRQPHVIDGVERFMLGCDECDEWYHGLCVDIDEEESTHIKKYVCAKCTSDGVAKIVFEEGYEPKEFRSSTQQ
jgi:Zn finger protein HypA/HybF involved in hydrogenase expression